MKIKDVLTAFKNDLCSDWKTFELVWLGMFIAVQILAFYLSPDSTLAVISGIAGIVCNVLVSKGKISNYFFGLIFAYTYFYVAWANNFLGEMNTTLYIYIPAQFIGFFMWKENMHANTSGVITKKLTLKQWYVLLTVITILTVLFVMTLRMAGSSKTELDGLTTIITLSAQTLMLLRYRDQWILWISLNVLSIALWAETPAMYIMFSAYLINSIYGFYNWSKLQTN